jgi:hypothetical protein
MKAFIVKNRHPIITVFISGAIGSIVALVIMRPLTVVDHVIPALAAIFCLCSIATVVFCFKNK